MVSEEELEVDYLGRSGSGRPCFLMQSGKVVLYDDSIESFLFFEEDRLTHAGEVVSTSSSVRMSSRSTSCVECNATMQNLENPTEINLLDETIKEDIDTSPQTLREFLHRVFYSSGNIPQTVDLDKTIICNECENTIIEEIQKVVEENSDFIVSSKI